MTEDKAEAIVCLPGELAPVSGVYEVRHLAHHRASHEAIVVRGEEFPLCRTCKGAVRYRLLRQTDHVHHDWDLAGPKTWAQPEKVVEFNGVRAFPRVEIDLPIVLVEMPASRKPLVVHGHAVNLSEGGLSVVIEPRLMHPKKNLLIRFPGSGARQDITVNARLRHRNGMRHGFEFVRLSEQSRNAVRELCQRAGA